MTADDTKQCIEERYSTAITTSNLKCEADRGGAADLLIAVGWSPSRLGAALMRLHTEYSSASIPPGAVSATDRVLLQCKLKSLSDVLQQVAIMAHRLDRLSGNCPQAVALAVVAWWLDRRCQVCTGRKFQLVPGTPSLSAKLCRVCRGAGETLLPHGEQGKRLARHLDESVERARASIKKRLFAMG